MKSKEQFTKDNLKRIKSDLINAIGIVEHWLESIDDKEYVELYAYINDTIINVEEIEHYPPKD